VGSLETKREVVAEVRGHFEESASVVLVDFQGIDVPTITDLRDRFRKAGVTYRVVKNNLIRQALKGTALEGNEALDATLKGMTGVAWSFEDPSAAAKVIKSFRKEAPENEKFEVKAGLLDDTVLTADQVENQLATMPGKDELRAMLLAQMMAPAQSFVRQIQAPMQNLVYALDARMKQIEEGGG
jgi:large subunit ribosomal protein L10